jgi:hypothetical protein
MTDYAVKPPDGDENTHCATEAEVRETLEEFRQRNPGTLFAGVSVVEMTGSSTTGTERSVFDFVPQ